MKEYNGLEKWVKQDSNVIVYNAPPSVVESISFGESAGLIDFAKKNEEVIDSVFWNEDFISIRSKQGEIIRFEPELNSEVQLFFTRKSSYRDRNTGYAVWDGDYEKV